MARPCIKSRGCGTAVGGQLLSWLAIVLAGGYIAYFWSNPIGDGIWSVFGTEMINPDGRSFLQYHRFRWVGYPLFLDLIGAAFGSVEIVPKVQLLAWVATVLFLVWSVRRTFQAPHLALVLELALLGASAVTRFHAYILSEALFIPLLNGMMGLLILMVARPRVGLVASAASMCGLAIAVRPSGLFFLAIWPVVLWFVWGRFAGKGWRLIAAVLVPLTGILGAERIIWHNLHEDLPERPSVANSHLFAKALMMDSTPRLEDEQLARFLSESRETMAPLRQLLAHAPEWQSRTILLLRSQSAGRHHIYRRLFFPRISTLAKQRGVSSDRLLADVAQSAVLAAPWQWAANTWVNYFALWAHYSICDAEFVQRWEIYTARLDAIPLLRNTGLTRPLRIVPSKVVFLNRLATVAASVASLVVLALAVWQRLRKGGRDMDDALIIAAVAALVVHAYFLLHALFSYASLRYASTMWSFQALYGLLLVHYALRHIPRRAKTRLNR